jgi:phenylalanyl-tRNA synthetase beta chain
MKVSLNWIKQYTDFALPPVDELVKKIGAQLGEVEGVENIGEKYQGVVIAKVVACDDHPNADRLHVCKIDDGGKTEGVERDENGHVQVVCGAPNVREGIVVAWLPPGSTVPESVHKDPFVLEVRELRGVKSNGMLASPKELAIGDNHDGILELDADKQPGDDFAAAYGLDDAVIDIENKMFTHRPDLFGELGLAREVAGITGHKFTSPDWYKLTPELPAGSGLELEVTNETPELAPRFMAVAIKDVTIKPSPLWLQCALVRMGQKPINNVVDITNYIMLLTAQPIHAYDYDKLRGHKLLARLAKPDEQLTLLNHKTYQLHPHDIVIADAEGAVGLAGVMGGGDSEVSDDTKNIVLECATFDMYAVRRSSMRHGVFTDALTRFNKGQSPLQNAAVLRFLLQSVFDVAGGETASQVFDYYKAAGREWVHPPVPVTTGFINTRLGLQLSAEGMQTLLENVEFEVTIDGDILTVTAPFWRTDIEIREDIVEEIGRLYGFDKLPQELPRRSIKPTSKNRLLELKKSIRENLVKSGANELLTYSFVHGNLLEKVGQDTARAFKIGNALSPDLQYYRLSLTPSLLEKIHPNIKAGFDSFALFEMGKSHQASELDEQGLPIESDTLAMVYTASDKVAPKGAAYYEAQRYLDELADTLTLTFEYIPVTDFPEDALYKPFVPNRSAFVRNVQNDCIVGVVGELTAASRRGLKLPQHCAAFEIMLQPLVDYSDGQKLYFALPKFPKVEQDICLRVGKGVFYADLYKLVAEKITAEQPENSRSTIAPLDIYQSSDNQSYKQITFRVAIASYEKTLKTEEVNVLLEQVAAAAAEKFGAERI